MLDFFVFSVFLRVGYRSLRFYLTIISLKSVLLNQETKENIEHAILSDHYRLTVIYSILELLSEIVYFTYQFLKR